MKLNRRFPMYFVLAGILILLAFAGWQTASAEGSIQVEPTPTPVFTFTDGVIIDLPPDATQLEVGKEVYRLVCSACHAYDGSGLTDDWRSTWAPDDQNCWQSKCHGDNHPPDGFFLPDSPAVIGSFFPYLFPNAQALFDYTMRTMPWHDPGSLPEDKGWAVTAHVLALNGYDVIEEINAGNAASFLINPPARENEPTESATALPTAVEEETAEVFIPMVEESIPETRTRTPILYYAFGGLVVVGLALLVFIWLRRR